MQDVASRLANRVQLTTDGHSAYLEAVEGVDVDYAQLVKPYGTDPLNPKGRYSPPVCTGSRKTTVEGEPDETKVSTSYVERQNLTMRMCMRRFTRLTKAFSKKLENHIHSLSLYFVYYNFIRVHKTLRVSPAMQADATDTLMSFEDFIEMIDARAPKPKRGPYKKRAA